MSKKPRAIVLGAYGFIGSACARALMSDGYEVTGIGRSEAAARRTGLNIDWQMRDIPPTAVEQWQADFADADIVINASGALQDGLDDHLYAIHECAVARICVALARGNAKLIQISAAGASLSAGTNFMRSKARGDDLIRSSTLDWCILRPGLVLGPQAYGGTALLRACAAVPLIGPVCFADTQVQTISVSELAQAVVTIANNRIASQKTYDLAEQGTHGFWEIVEAVRHWQGFPAWKMTVSMPRLLIRGGSLIADMLGWLGWRSPFRSNALRELSAGIVVDISPWIKAGGKPFSTLAETLLDLPSTNQERWFARLYLLLPVTIFVLALFWVASGVIGLIFFEEAKTVLATRGFSEAAAMSAVAVGSVVDIGLGALLVVRKWAGHAALGMVMVSLAYLLGASIWAPDLWSDPLGALVKVLPSILPAFLVMALVEKR